MTIRTPIHTREAPGAIGPYSQAIRMGDVVYLSGQIPLNPVTMQLVSADFKAQVVQVFNNLQAVITAIGSGLNHIAKLTIYLTDLTQMPLLNEMMTNYFSEPYPARTTVQVTALPKMAQIEIDAILHL